jgi:hypothetical protein
MGRCWRGGWCLPSSPKKEKETRGEEEEELSSGETSHVLAHHPVSLLSGGA